MALLLPLPPPFAVVMTLDSVAYRLCAFVSLQQMEVDIVSVTSRKGRLSWSRLSGSQHRRCVAAKLVLRCLALQNAQKRAKLAPAFLTPVALRQVCCLVKDLVMMQS